jgi:hypothetical protein
LFVNDGSLRKNWLRNGVDAHHERDMSGPHRKRPPLFGPRQTNSNSNRTPTASRRIARELYERRAQDAAPLAGRLSCQHERFTFYRYIAVRSCGSLSRRECDRRGHRCPTVASTGTPGATSNATPTKPPTMLLAPVLVPSRAATNSALFVQESALAGLYSPCPVGHF